MKYVAIFHANLNYAYLTPDRYEFVIRKSYELLLDTMAEEFPDVKFVFEASGYTIEQIALRTPDVLSKLKAAINEGRCEFMGSPYAHPMLPNFPREDGEWSIRFSNETFQKFLGMTPKSFWNPECGWRDYVPQQVANCGYANMIGDFEAYSRSLNPDGTPQRPEIYEKEKTDDTSFYSFGFKYKLPGDERAIHFPFNKIHGLEEDQLRMFLRTDRVAQFGVRFFMGMEGYTLEKYLDLVRKYSQQKPDEPEGAVIIFADDAEYIGTNGWFRLKYQNKPDNVFEEVPDAREKLVGLISACKEMGSFATFDEACQTLPPMEETINFDDDTAWHGGQASTWASTPMAKLLRPWQDLVRDKLNASDFSPAQTKLAWLHLTNSYNSDGQWPPTLPDAPHIIHPFNYGYCFENLLRAHLLVGGVDLSKLEPKAKQTAQTILGLQQDLVLKKADSLDSVEGAAARMMIETTRDLSTLGDDARLLYPAEYAVRAEALVEARRLVGGVEIEKVDADADAFTDGEA
jgi:alpha-amylase/alpha-mannosidase (GH57 family)